MSKFFAALLIMLERPNYFDSSTKLFSNLYLAKYLDASAKQNFFRVSFNLFLHAK